VGERVSLGDLSFVEANGDPAHELVAAWQEIWAIHHRTDPSLTGSVRRGDPSAPALARAILLAHYRRDQPDRTTLVALFGSADDLRHVLADSIEAALGLPVGSLPVWQ